MKIIVVAGGQGTKLWPYSRENKPKQFQKIVGEKTLFTNTVDTLLNQYNSRDIYISTKKKYVHLAAQQAPSIPLKNYIVEPDVAKDRGPAEGFAVLKLSLEHPDEPFILIQSDVLWDPAEKFLTMIKDIEELVIRDKKFVSGGIKATYPILGVDYLKLGDKVNVPSRQEVFSVDSFVGRTEDYFATKELVENFHVVTHSNHTSWYPDMFLEAYKKYKPDWYEALMQIKDVVGKSDEEEKTSVVYSSMEGGPTEIVTKHVFPEGYIVMLNFKWTDIGTWNSIYEFFANNSDVYSDGNALSLDSSGTLVKCDNPKKFVAIAGIEDLVIVDTEDILMVVPRKHLEKIKEIQKAVRDSDNKIFL